MMVLCRAGRFDKARAVFPRACESVHKDETDIPETYKVLIFWALGFELARYPAMSDLALAAFEASLADPYSSFQFRMLRATGRVPARELVPLALRTGRRDEARRALLGCASSSWSATGYAEETNRAIRMVGLDLIGTSLVEMGFAADAIPLFGKPRSCRNGWIRPSRRCSFPNYPSSLVRSKST